MRVHVCRSADSAPQRQRLDLSDGGRLERPAPGVCAPTPGPVSLAKCRLNRHGLGCPRASARPLSDSLCLHMTGNMSCQRETGAWSLGRCTADVMLPQDQSYAPKTLHYLSKEKLKPHALAGHQTRHGVSHPAHSKHIACAQHGAAEKVWELRNGSVCRHLGPHEHCQAVLGSLSTPGAQES